jgi:uncharacterized protein YggE
MDEALRVVGVGSASATPDAMTVQLAAEAVGATVQAALDEARGALERIRASLLERGVEPSDLRSTEFSIWPKQDPAGASLGFECRLGLAATVQGPASGELISAAVAAGGDSARLGGVSFGIGDASGLARQAREAAWADARDKAEQYAALSGRTLGRVLAVAEVPDRGPVPVRMALASGNTPLPVDGGTTGVTITVEVQWELG